MKTDLGKLLAAATIYLSCASPVMGDECKGIVIKDIPGKYYDAKVGTIIEMLHEYEGTPEGIPVSYAVHGGGVYPADHIKILNCSLRKTATDPFYELILNNTPGNAHAILYQKITSMISGSGIDYADASNAAEAYLSSPHTACGILAKRLLDGDSSVVPVIMNSQICQPSTK